METGAVAVPPSIYYFEQVPALAQFGRLDMLIPGSAQEMFVQVPVQVPVAVCMRRPQNDLLPVAIKIAADLQMRVFVGIGYL